MYLGEAIWNECINKKSWSQILSSTTRAVCSMHKLKVSEHAASAPCHNRPIWSSGALLHYWVRLCGWSIKMSHYRGRKSVSDSICVDSVCTMLTNFYHTHHHNYEATILSWASAHSAFQGATVTASILMYGILILGKRSCGPKLWVMFNRPWALTRDTAVYTRDVVKCSIITMTSYCLIDTTNNYSIVVCR